MGHGGLGRISFPRLNALLFVMHWNKHQNKALLIQNPSSLPAGPNNSETCTVTNTLLIVEPIPLFRSKPIYIPMHQKYVTAMKYNTFVLQELYLSCFSKHRSSTKCYPRMGLSLCPYFLHIWKTTGSNSTIQHTGRERQPPSSTYIETNF